VEEEYFTVNSDFVAQDSNQITCLDGDKVCAFQLVEVEGLKGRESRGIPRCNSLLSSGSDGVNYYQVRLVRKVNGDWWVIQNMLGAQGEVPAKQLTFYTPTQHDNAGSLTLNIPSVAQFY